MPALAYAASMLALYAASSAYHLIPGSERLTRRLRKLGHSAIFLCIAGTCTPVFWRAFEGGTRISMLAATWTLAAIGIALRVAWMHAPRALYASMYVAMGWLIVAKGGVAFRALPVSRSRWWSQAGSRTR